MTRLLSDLHQRCKRYNQQSQATCCLILSDRKTFFTWYKKTGVVVWSKVVSLWQLYDDCEIPHCKENLHLCCHESRPQQRWCYSVTQLFLFLKTPFCSLVTSLVPIFISQTDADGAAGVTDVCSGTNRLPLAEGTNLHPSQTLKCTSALNTCASLHSVFTLHQTVLCHQFQ